MTKTIVLDIEVWRPVLGFEGRYEISNKGRLKSLPYEKQGRNVHGTFSYMTQEKLLKATYTHDGYLQCSLRDSSSGKDCCKKVHRLVAEAFLHNPENRPQVNHINGIKDDNNVENLEWVTCQENVIHSYKTDLASNKGERHPRAKFTHKDIQAIRERRRNGELLREIADTYGVCISTISKVCKRRHYPCVL